MIAAALFALAVPLLPAQDTVRVSADGGRAEALRVFLDCDDCEFDYLRTEITFVNWVRDRAVAQLHLLVTRQRTGSGTQYTLTFIGLGSLAGRGDTLVYASSSTDVADERRRGLARTMRLGLVRHVARTSLAGQLDVLYDSRTPPPRPHDPWNFWVFEIAGGADFDGESSRRSRDLNANLEARRVTDRWKIGLEFDYSDRSNTYVSQDTLGNDSISRFSRHEWSFDGLLVRSLGPRWALGALLEVQQNSFRNYDLQVRTAPAVEFSIFPYRESTRRLATLRYAIGVEHADYADSTIYGRLDEQLPLHYLRAGLEARQPWGSTYFSAEFLQYLHDPSKLNIEVNAHASVRLVRGLELNFYGSYEVIRDQLYLSAKGSTLAEIIAQQRAQATGYSYSTGFGLSYTFGSIFNNVVNPRFN